ncbi:hypothetical protein CTA2_3260 [Colletotrichum tanaceti]|uniref:Tyrosinase copper-binding domain-containing protein n=1 Tax=Colletotrichum tanaceti TaxID=1306861 RepID=A0A4U6XPL3_9PEZI|nr:hypothetical protein CTA2_3260 [Colletotrichum tanaceti]TKW57745.1 hypothetical protein CTA1_9176 [Colletotrichum tanaceti]
MSFSASEPTQQLCIMRVSYLAPVFIGGVVAALLTQNIQCHNPAVACPLGVAAYSTERHSKATWTPSNVSKRSPRGSAGARLQRSLYDDFPYIHAHLDTSRKLHLQELRKETLSLLVHFVASFLPWHRYFVHVYERALQDCGHIGVAPASGPCLHVADHGYWDWTLDVANVETCVQDGSFNDLRVEYMALRGQGRRIEEIGDMFPGAHTPDAVQVINNSTTYDSFRIGLENGPYGLYLYWSRHCSRTAVELGVTS